MALYPYSRMSKEMLQPGARGEQFQNNGIPGHRVTDQRVNRTNNTLNLSEHDVTNIKYAVDPRLPVQFRYGWAYGYNQIVMPKGRIVAVDPNLLVFDTDMLNYHNALTLANGGNQVKVPTTGATLTKDTTTVTVDTDTGYLKEGSNVRKDLIPANIPIGILERNEYTRDDNAFNGIMPGAIRTDAMVEIPWFTSKTVAEKNPWGAAYGALKPGDIVCSDENGRFVKSALSGTVPTAITDYEAARQQIVGHVYATSKDLVPEGAAKYVQWALEDRRNFHDFDPYTWPTSNRRGEDFVKNVPTAHQSEYKYPGYPYERNYMASDLHMLASQRGVYDPRFDLKHRYDQGIPGLTDGYNAVSQTFGTGETLPIGEVGIAAKAADAVEAIYRTPDVNLESFKVKIGTNAAVQITAATTYPVAVGSDWQITYADVHKGLFAVKQKTDAAAGTAGDLTPINISYVKRGMAGVPTNLDWEGCQGTVKILLQR